MAQRDLWYKKFTSLDSAARYLTKAESIANSYEYRWIPQSWKRLSKIDSLRINPWCSVFDRTGDMKRCNDLYGSPYYQLGLGWSDTCCQIKSGL